MISNIAITPQDRLLKEYATDTKHKMNSVQFAHTHALTHTQGWGIIMYSWQKQRGNVEIFLSFFWNYNL